MGPRNDSKWPIPLSAVVKMKSDPDQLRKDVSRRLAEPSPLLLTSALNWRLVATLEHGNAQILMRCNEPVTRRQFREVRTLNRGFSPAQYRADGGAIAQLTRKLLCPPELKQLAGPDRRGGQQVHLRVHGPAVHLRQNLGHN
jgi:hypothetical protein